MGAKQIKQYWNRAVLTALDFVELWQQEVPGDDPYDALAMLADLVSRDYRCTPYPWYQDPLFELFKPELGEQRREAQAAAARSLRAIVSDRNGIDRARDVHVLRDGLVKAFEQRGTAPPRFLLPPSLAADLRRAHESGELAAAFKTSRASNLGCDHTPDFRSVRWFHVRHLFSLSQARAIEALWHAWEDGELALSQKEIGEAVGSSSDDFRLKKLFKDLNSPTGMHPAWDTMIHSLGRGQFALGRPPAAATTAAISAEG